MNSCELMALPLSLSFKCVSSVFVDGICVYNVC